MEIDINTLENIIFDLCTIPSQEPKYKTIFLESWEFHQV